MGVLIPFMVMIFFEAIHACFPPFIPDPPLPAPQITVAVANPSEPLTTSPCRFDWSQVQVTGCLVKFVRYSVMLKRGETIVQKLETNKNTATISLPPVTAQTPHTFEVQAVAWFGSGITEVGKIAVTIGAATPASGSPNSGQYPTQENGPPPGQQIVAAPPINSQASQPGLPPPSSGPQIPVPQPPEAIEKPPAPDKTKAETRIKAPSKLLVPYPDHCTISNGNGGNKKLKFEFDDDRQYEMRIYKVPQLEVPIETKSLKKTVSGFGRSKLDCPINLKQAGTYLIQVFPIDADKVTRKRWAEAIILFQELPTMAVPECQWKRKEKLPIATITSPTSSPCRVKELGQVSIKWEVTNIKKVMYVVRFRANTERWESAVPPAVESSNTGSNTPAIQTYTYTLGNGLNIVQVAAFKMPVPITGMEFLSDWATVLMTLPTSTTDDSMALKECQWT